MRRILVTVFLLAVLLGLGTGGWALWWVSQPMRLTAVIADTNAEPAKH